ncbi:unnamed protein product [Urochloa humidicola]
MAAAAGRLLSDLPDDVLRRILFFMGDKEAASTAVLSRRFHSLWRTSGVVYLDSRYFNCRSDDDEEPEKPAEAAPMACGHDNPPWDYDPWAGDDWAPNNNSSKEREYFIHVAEKALAAAAAAAPIRRLTFVVKSDMPEIFPFPGMSSESQHDLIDPVISNPVARRVEELHVEVLDWNNRRLLGIGSLPSEALRVLRLVNCCLLPAAVVPPALPCLAELDLRNCTVSVVGLQGMVDAAPRLATLHLESFSMLEADEVFVDIPPVQAQWRHRLVCPAVTALVFVDCSRLLRHDEAILELDMPKLQSLMYKGDVQLTEQLSLKTPDMIQVDLHLVEDYNTMERIPVPLLFWRFIRNFRAEKLLKLKLDFSMDRVAAIEGAHNLDDLVCKRDTLFHNLERLELDAQYCPRSEASLVVLATLLQCCPMVRDLQLMLSKDLASQMPNFSIDQEARADFDKSVNRFRHRRKPTISPGGEDDDRYEAFDMPVFSKMSFICLQSHLKRVSLHFCMDKPNCLGVQLAKFFASKAMVLEELYIDDGSQKMREHANNSIGRWMDSSTKTRDLVDIADAVLAH